MRSPECGGGAAGGIAARRAARRRPVADVNERPEACSPPRDSKQRGAAAAGGESGDAQARPALMEHEACLPERLSRDKVMAVRPGNAASAAPGISRLPFSA